MVLHLHLSPWFILSCSSWANFVENVNLGLRLTFFWLMDIQLLWHPLSKCFLPLKWFLPPLNFFSTFVKISCIVFMGLFLGSPFCSIDLCLSSRHSFGYNSCMMSWYPVDWFLILPSSFINCFSCFTSFALQ